MGSQAESVVRQLAAAIRPSSEHAILADDTVVVSLFASLDPDGRKAHVPQVMGVRVKIPGEAMAQLYEVFEAEKLRFRMNDCRSFMGVALSIRNQLVRDRVRPYYRGLTPAALDALKW